MIIYIKLGKVRGLSIEINKGFGLKPYFEKNSFHQETIIDITWGQIIYTSGKWVPKNKRSKKPVVTPTMLKRRTSNVNSQGYQISKRVSGANGD